MRPIGWWWQGVEGVVDMMGVVGVEVVPAGV